MLEKEERAVREIFERFPYLEGKLTIQRKQRIIAEPLPRKKFEEVFSFVSAEGGFHRFHLISGVDYGSDLGFVYILSNQDNIVLMLEQIVPKSYPGIHSVCSVFPNALWHEREAVDLFGAVVEDIPRGPSYPLPDGWPKGNYPLRKDWKVEYFDKETMTYNPPESEKDKLSDNMEGSYE